MRFSERLQRWLQPPLLLWQSGLAGRCLLLASVLFIPGLLAPILTLDTLNSSPASYSVAGGVVTLFVKGKVTLGLIVLGFSVLFPIAKLYLLMSYLSKPSPSTPASWLLLVGKWSMLDVFVVAVIVGAGRLRLLSSFESEMGVYWFGSAVALSMIGAELMLGSSPAPSWEKPQRRWTDWVWAVLGAAAALLVIAGLSLPLMEINKWLFWSNNYSVFAALPEMWSEGEWLLPILLMATVCVAPVLKLLFSAGFRLSGSASLFHLSELANRWSMLSVFMLSLVLVMVKLGDSTSVSALSGFWLLLAGGLINLADSLSLRGVTKRITV